MVNKQKRILLVEDEAITAMDETRHLRNYRYDVVHALTGEKAVEIIKTGEPEVDLVLMDIDLGAGMDGTVAAQEILKRKDIPVVFLSSHTEKAIVEKTEGITAYGYILKFSGMIVIDACIKMAFKLFDAHQEVKFQKEELEAAFEELEAVNEQLRGSQELIEEQDVLLKESEEKFSLAFRISPHPVCITHPAEGEFVEVNDAFCKVIGYTREEILRDSSLGLQMWVNTDDRKCVLLELVHGRPVISKEYKFRKKNGEIIIGLYSAQMLPLRHGMLIMSSVDDITDVVKMEDRIAELEGKVS